MNWNDYLIFLISAAVIFLLMTLSVQIQKCLLSLTLKRSFISYCNFWFQLALFFIKKNKSFFYYLFRFYLLISILFFCFRLLGIPDFFIMNCYYFFYFIKTFILLPLIYYYLISNHEFFPETHSFYAGPFETQIVKETTQLVKDVLLDSGLKKPIGFGLLVGVGVWGGSKIQQHLDLSAMQHNSQHVAKICKDVIESKETLLDDVSKKFLSRPIDQMDFIEMETHTKNALSYSFNKGLNYWNGTPDALDKHLVSCGQASSILRKAQFSIKPEIPCCLEIVFFPF